MSKQDYTLDDLTQLSTLELKLETRVCEFALRLAAFDVDSPAFAVQLEHFRNAFADYQAAKAVSDVAAGRSEQWKAHDEARAELRRERMRERMEAWLDLIHRAERFPERDAELIKVTAHISAEIANAVIPLEVDANEVERRFAKRLHAALDLRSR